MSNYRLKKEAVPFMHEKHATKIYSLGTWESLGVDIKALDKVEPAYITQGRKTSETTEVLSGWDAKDGSRFEFTVHFPSNKFHEHDKFSKGRIMRDLLNKMQNQINSFYQDFLETEPQ